MNAQTYLDFATPAIAAGAMLKKDRTWQLNGNRYGAVDDLCEENGIEPVKLDPPKARTLAQLKRDNLAALHRGNTRTGRDGLAMRAMHYALALRGVETKIDEFLYNAAKRCVFGKASDGSTRVRAIRLDDGQYEIPNWDFVATLLPVEPEGVFA